MKKITVETKNKYDVLIGKHLIGEMGNLIKEVVSPCKALIISDSNVFKYYGKAASSSLDSAGFDVYTHIIAPGEMSKNIENYKECVEYLASLNFTRTDLVIALGGGVVGDLSGFVAATYLRGIRFIQVPTTFLSAIDSSVGGKTGVNLSHGKNLLGAFWQPSLVICDTNCFKTLSHETFMEGTAEAIKYGIILDKLLFKLLYDNAPLYKDFKELDRIVANCINIKGKVVSWDERDEGQRQLLNLGHTIGHAIEKCSNYRVSHGAAVATGISIITKACYDFGYTDANTLYDIINILERQGFKTNTEFSAPELLNAILKDKKRGGSNINLILPLKIGDSEIRQFPVNSLEGFLEAGLR